MADLYTLLTGERGVLPMEGPLPRLDATGEVFLMRPYCWHDQDDPDFSASIRAWGGLKETIEACGGEVRLLDATYNRGNRSPIFVRDLGLFSEGQMMIFPETFQSSTVLPEINTLRRFSRESGEALPIKELDGFLEGGNIVSYAPGQIHFVGVTHRDAHYSAELLRAEGLLYHPKDYKAYYRDQQKQHLPHYLKAYEGLAAGSGRRVMPLYIKPEHVEEFYHLDGALGVLPSGEAVVCKEVFGHASQGMLERYIGRDRIIPISREDALKGSANLITVGSHVITPYAPTAMRTALHQAGYQVITPKEVGLAEGDWMFAPMGSVRCATLKVTPDKGFPERVQEKGRAI